MFLRIATLATGLLPIVLAPFASQVLTVTFLAKALRAALAVLVVMMFYLPRFGSRRGAFWSIILPLVTTIGWFLAGNPYGVDNAYVAVATPLIVMTISHLWRTKERQNVPVSVQPDAGSLTTADADRRKHMYRQWL